MSLAIVEAPWKSESHRKPMDNDHEYLRRQVDPVLMPMIEALLLQQPTSIYEYILKYVSEGDSSSDHDATNTGTHMTYVKKLSSRRQMASFMATSVIPVMDDLARQIVREKPNNVKNFIRDVVALRVRVGSGSSLEPALNQVEEMVFHVGDQVECRYRGRPRYVRGTIVSKNDAVDGVTTYMVQYEDGKQESNVHPMCLRPAEQSSVTKSASSAPPATVVNLAPLVMNMVVLILGLDGAGKTTLLSTLQGDLEKEHVPSAGFTSVQFEIEKGTAAFYDLGGGPAFRSVWKEYFADAYGVVFVLNAAAEPQTMETAFEMLESSMSHPLLKQKPLLVFANKQDQPNCWRTQQVEERVKTIAGVHNFRVLGCVAKPSVNQFCVDDHLEVGLAWLFNQIEGEYSQLDLRVRNDLEAKKLDDFRRKEEQKKRVTAWKEEKERAEMLRHDDKRFTPVPPATKHEGDGKPAKTADPSAAAAAIQCFYCKERLAVTKCAASKWMPVCEPCATSLKQQKAPV